MEIGNANAICQRLCGERILRCEQGFRYGSDYYYQLVGKFAPSAIVRLLEISVKRNWWMVFGYDDTASHAKSQSIREFGAGLNRFDWECSDKAFQLRQLLSGVPMGVVFDGHFCKRRTSVSGIR